MSTRRAKKALSLFRTSANSEENPSVSNLYCWGEVPEGKQTFQTLLKSRKTKDNDDNIVQPTELKLSTDSSPIISVSASSNHVICVSNEFKMYGSGDNSFGQLFPLKQGKKNVSFAPLNEIPVLRKSLKVVQVSCGQDFTAYLTNIGRVYTFGGNSYGQLAHSHDRRQSYVAPRMITGVAHEIIVQVSCGDFSTYVLTKHGKVYSAGCGRNGRLGVANVNLFIKSRIKKIPVYISEMLEIKDASVKDSYLEQSRSEMTEVKGPLKGLPIVSIAAGGAHCLAVSNSGRVYGWGSNCFGQLGLDLSTAQTNLKEADSDFDESELDGVPVPVSLGIDNISSIAAGRNHSLFLSQSKTELFVAGDNRQRQCGPLDLDAVERVLQLKWDGLTEESTSIEKIACGAEHSALVLTSGNVIVLGYKANMSGTYSFGKSNVEAPEKGVYLINSAKAFNVACGGNMTYLLTSDDYASLLKQGEKQANLLKKVHPIGLSGKNLSTETASKDIFLKLRKTLFDVQTLNASFLLSENEKQKREDVIKTESIQEDRLHSSNIDIEGMLNTTSLFTKAKYSDQQKLKIRQLVASIVAQLELNAAVVTEPDQLRAYLILAVSPLLREICPAEHEIILVSVFKFPLETRRMFFSWIYTDIACKDVNLLLESLVKPMLSQLDNLVKRRKFTKQAVHLCKFLHCLYQVCMKINEEAENRQSDLTYTPKTHIPSAAFYTQAFDSFPDSGLENMYRKWHAVVVKGGRELNGQRTRGIFGRQMIINQESNRIERANSDQSLRSIEHKAEPVTGQTYGLKKFGLDFVTLLDNTLEDTLSNISPDLVFFKHPFLLSATTKRRFMRIEDNNMHTRFYLHSFASALEAFLVLEVRRGKDMIQDTFAKLRALLSKDNHELMLRRPLKIKFHGEDGLDAGGVKKEFFLLLSQDLFSPDFAIFRNIGADNLIWFSNVIDTEYFQDEAENVSFDAYQAAVAKAIEKNPEKFNNIVIVGTIMGLAVYNDTLLDVSFPAAMYQLIINRFDPDKLDLSKFKKFDANGAKQLEYLKGITDPEEMGALDMRFEVTQEHYGVVKNIELCPNGSKKVVTVKNIDDYIKCYIRFKMYSPYIEAQAKALRKGFTQVISAQHAALNLFNTDELELLLCGTPELDFKVLKEVSTYEGGYNENHTTVKWFWEVLEEMNYEQRQKFLKFTTGSSRAPIGGLKNVKFKLQRAGPDSPQLPTSHTCFNTLMVPEYSSKEKMKRLILLAIENSEGFGLQ